MGFDSPFVFSYTDDGGDSKRAVVPAMILEYEYANNSDDIYLAGESMCVFCDIAQNVDSYIRHYDSCGIEGVYQSILDLGYAIRGYFCNQIPMLKNVLIF